MSAKFKSLKPIRRILPIKKLSTPTDFSKPNSEVCHLAFDHVPHRQYLEANECTPCNVHADVLAFIRQASSHRSQMLYQLQDMSYIPLTELRQQQEEMLRWEIYRLECRIFEAQTIISPVRRLTFDTLQEIFLRCLPGRPHDSELDEYYPTSTQDVSLRLAVTLSHVSRSWRSTALSLSALWSNLPTHRGVSSTSTPHREVLPLIRMAVDRTRNSELTFTLYLPHLPSPFSSQASVQREKDEVEEHLDPTLSFLIDHSEKWGNVTLFNLSSNHIPILSKIKGRLTNLKYLQLRTYCPWRSIDFASLMDLLDNTSKLQSFVSHGFSRPCYGPVTAQHTSWIPLQRLTNIEASFHSPDDLRDVATTCSDTLQTLKISADSMLGQPYYQFNSDPQVQFPVYEFSQLASLHIACTTGNTFKFLSLPVLEHLTWDFAHNYYSPVQFLPLSDMISRSSNRHQTGRHHPLKYLHIIGTLGVTSLSVPEPECQEMQLVALFKLLPNLSTLHCPWPGFSVVRALTRTLDTPCPQLLPSLELCVLTDTHVRWPQMHNPHGHFTDILDELAKALNDFAASRCEFSSLALPHEGSKDKEVNSGERLKAFHILLGGSSDGLYLHRHMLRPLAPKTLKPSSTFASLLATLAQDVPGAFSDTWDPWNPTDPPVWHKNWHMWRSRVVRTFSQIAALDLGIWTIYETGWHFCLEALRMLFLNDSEFYHHHSFFYEIVRDLHEECVRKFDEHPWTQRWLLSPNDRVLLYIPKDDPIMSTSYTSDIVYDRGRECPALQEAFSPLLRHISNSDTVSKPTQYQLLGY